MLVIRLAYSYVASRIFLHNPPGEGNAFRPSADAPRALHEKEEEMRTADAKLNQWYCIVFLVVTIAIMAATAEIVRTHVSIRQI